jgi:LPXTG-motif cell wall-anchored protein
LSLLTSSELPLAAFKIAAVSELSPAVAPAACDAFLDDGDSYPRVFSVTFEPLDVTFSQTVNGQEWIYRVVMAPGTQYVAGTLPPGEDAWDSDEPLCISQGNYLAGGSSSGPDVEGSWGYAYFMSQLVAPYSSNDGSFVADYPRSASTELPATGLNSLVPLGVGALTLAVGGLAIALRRRHS